MSYMLATKCAPQDVETAIKRSVSHNEIVFIDTSASGVNSKAYINELVEACEDWVQGNDWLEYWGVIEDDEKGQLEWRVHLIVKSEE